MANIYCPNCGKKHFFNLKRPEKCDSCGSSFSPNNNKNIPQKKNEYSVSEKTQNLNTSYDEDYSESLSVPKIKSLAYDLNFEGISKTIKGKDIIGEAPTKTKQNDHKWKRKVTKHSKSK